MINILYCGNDAVFEGIMLSLLSAITYSNEVLNVYVATMDLQDVNPAYKPITKPQINYLNFMVKDRNLKSRVQLIDGTKIFNEVLGNNANLFSAYTPYTMLRLLADKFDLPEFVLYLDVDTMFYNDISTIEQYRPKKEEYSAVVDYLGKTFISKEYVNAGVMYLNIEKIRETGLFEKTRKMCSESTMAFPDQDALNAATTSKKLIPGKFNEQHKLNSDTVIRHFAKTIYFFPLLKY